MIFAFWHAALGWGLASLACFALRRRSAAARCWAWRLGLLKGPLALLLAVPVVVVTQPLPAFETPPDSASVEGIDKSYRTDRTDRSYQKGLDPLPYLYGAGVLAVAFARLGAARRVHRGMPRVEGVFRPRVVIPGGLTPDAAAMALAHETAHVRRRDPQWSFAADLVCAVLWFAPPVWLCARAMRAESEAACDAAALRDTASDPRAYARLLLAFAGPAPANALGGPARRLARRIIMLDKQAKPVPRLIGGALLAVGLVVLLPWRAEAQTSVAPKPQVAKRVSKARRAQLAAEQAAFQARIAALRAQTQALQAQVEALRTQKRSAESTIGSMLDRQRALAQRLKAVQQALGAQKAAQIAALEAQLRAARAAKSPPVSRGTPLGGLAWLAWSAQEMTWKGKSLYLSGDVKLSGEPLRDLPAPQIPGRPMKIVPLADGSAWHIYREGDGAPYRYRVEHVPAAKPPSPAITSPMTEASMRRILHLEDRDVLEFRPDPDRPGREVADFVPKNGPDNQIFFGYRVFRQTDGKGGYLYDIVTVY